MGIVFSLRCIYLNLLSSFTQEIGRKPQSMTLSSFQKIATSADEEQFISFTQSKSLSEKKGNHITPKFNNQLQQINNKDLSTSKSVDILMSKIKKPTEAMQQLAKLPRLHHKPTTTAAAASMTQSPTSRLSQTQALLGNNFQPISVLTQHQSDQFRVPNHHIIVKHDDHTIQINELKKQITAAVMVMNATTNKKFEQTLTAENNQITVAGAATTYTDSVTVTTSAVDNTIPTTATDAASVHSQSLVSTNTTTDIITCKTN